ncbi:MAG TPA: porin [Methylophilaceae bacterium]
MKQQCRFPIKLMVVALAAAFPIASFADDNDADARIKQLENMVQQMQQQRAEQDKQIDILTKELSGIENQISQSKTAKVEEKGKSKGNPVYGSFKNGLVLEDGSGNWALQVNGRIQADYRTYDPGEWRNDNFTIRRARLGATFTFLQDYAVRVEGEYANSNDGAKSTTAMTYGYVEYNHFAGARVRIGQFKPIFGLERAESTNFTDFQELSMATATGASFNSTYDRGLMLFGAPIKGTYYNLSYVNGSGQNNDSLKDSKDVVGRVTANVADWAGWSNAVVHLGISGSHGSVEPSSATGSMGLSNYTEANGVTSNATATSTNDIGTKYFSTAAFNTRDIDKSRIGLEGALAYGPVKLQSEYIDTNFDGTTAAGKGFDKDIDAWYANLTWLVTGENYADSYKEGMFGRIVPKHNFATDLSGWGAFELGLRYSEFDASDFKGGLTCAAGSGCLTAATGTASFTTKADAWTAGAKWIMTPNSRLMFNYIHTSFDNAIIINSKSSDTEDAVTLRAQYDF